jgi:hypothetical protein
MENIIYVNYLSRFANNIFQYALAHIIKDLIDGEIYFSPTNVLRSGKSHDHPAEEMPIEDIPIFLITDSKNIMKKAEWSGKFREDEKEALRKTGVWFAEDLLTFDSDRLVISDSYRGQPIILAGYYQDFRYYKGRKAFVLGLLNLYPLQRYPGEHDIVLNFRGTDLSGVQMPFSYYRWILDQEQFDRLWIVTEDPHHETVVRLSDCYSGEVLSNGAISDFTFVMSAKKIIMSVSTFCWMAAWLSDADKIYFPRGSHYAGFGKDNDRLLIVTDDQRYVYIKPVFQRASLRKMFPFYRYIVFQSKLDRNGDSKVFVETLKK